MTGRRVTGSAIPSHSMAIRSRLVLIGTTIKALTVEASTSLRFPIATPPRHRRTAA